MRTRAGARWPGEAGEPLIDLADVTEIELIILRRMREFTIGEHASRFHGSGFDFVGLRDWQAGDRFESIDWPQSSLTNFSPLIVREFEQHSTSTVMMVADRSLSTRCGKDGVAIAATIARTLATVGMSAVFFQDSVGLITFDHASPGLQAIRPRIGKAQVIRCLEAYQTGHGLETLSGGAIEETLAGFLRKTALVPVISDFLFEPVDDLLAGLARINGVHDVVLAIIDAGFAFELPGIGAGWVGAFDVESGRARLMSRRELKAMARGVRAWQDRVAQRAKEVDIDVLRLEADATRFDVALLEWVAERRLRRR